MITTKEGHFMWDLRPSRHDFTQYAHGVPKNACVHDHMRGGGIRCNTFILRCSTNVAHCHIWCYHNIITIIPIEAFAFRIQVEPARQPGGGGPPKRKILCVMADTHAAAGKKLPNLRGRETNRKPLLYVL